MIKASFLPDGRFWFFAKVEITTFDTSKAKVYTHPNPERVSSPERKIQTDVNPQTKSGKGGLGIRQKLGSLMKQFYPLPTFVECQVSPILLANLPGYRLASRLFDAMLFFSFSHQHKGEQFPHCGNCRPSGDVEGYWGGCKKTP